MSFNPDASYGLLFHSTVPVVLKAGLVLEPMFQSEREGNSNDGELVCRINTEWNSFNCKDPS
jgi:hypothetical protein